MCRTAGKSGKSLDTLVLQPFPDGSPAPDAIRNPTADYDFVVCAAGCVIRTFRVQLGAVIWRAVLIGQRVIGSKNFLK